MSAHTLQDEKLTESHHLQLTATVTASEFGGVAIIGEFLNLPQQLLDMSIHLQPLPDAFIDSIGCFLAQATGFAS